MCEGVKFKNEVFEIIEKIKSSFSIESLQINEALEMEDFNLLKYQVVFYKVSIRNIEFRLQKWMKKVDYLN
ncbi:MAG: hypothetical protein RR904_06475 [Bacilli bacterium]